MAELIVIKLDNQHEADKLREAWAKSQREGLAELDKVALVERDEEDNINIWHKLALISVMVLARAVS